MFIQINTIDDLQAYLDELKCVFATKVYRYYTQEMYALKKCSTDEDFDIYSTYIEILERKIKMIKYQCEIADYNNPSVLTETDTNNVLDNELYLTDCDNKLIHKIKALL